MKKIMCVLYFLFFWLQYSFWFGKNGVYDFFSIKNNVTFNEYNDRRVILKKENDMLSAEINDLVNHKEEAIEERARSELGMIKLDEIFYNLISVDGKDYNE